MLSASELAELNQIRLDEDLTYRELSARIGVGFSKLHNVLNTAPSKVRTNDRTAHKIRRYLEAHRQQVSR